MTVKIFPMCDFLYFNLNVFQFWISITKFIFLDQWSPYNQLGKKCYDRDFLICLQNNPKSKKKPENLPDLDVVLKDSNRARILDSRAFTINRQSEVLMPAFHKSLSQRGPITKRNSQQGKAGSKSNKPNAIHVTLSLKEDVKLRETENAWRPARLSNSSTKTEDEQKTAVSFWLWID